MPTDWETARPEKIKLPTRTLVKTIDSLSNLAFLVMESPLRGYFSFLAFIIARDLWLAQHEFFDIRCGTDDYQIMQGRVNVECY